MYSEDRYHPTNNDDTYLAELLEKNSKKRKNPFDETKPSTEAVLLSSNSRYGKGIKCYSSGGMGTPIIDAVTGGIFSGHEKGEKLIRHLIGSKYEDLYFKIKDRGNTFFYHGPDEFEKHRGIVLGENTKRIWREKYTKMQYEIYSAN